ncbi:MAG: hypothetical protein HN348_35655, partial [Proteobacteria bacterium]|nr:hypothetical protein [Pseudomonadota bacterium]
SEHLYWSNAYVFYSDSEPGITASFSHPRTDGTRGVVAIDISLRDFSGFLENLDIGEHGTAFVLDGRGQFIASPNFGDLQTVEETVNGVRTVVRRLEDSLLPEISSLSQTSAMSDVKKAGQEVHLSYDVGGVAWLGTLTPMKVSVEAPWLVGIVAPEDDFLGEIRRSNMNNAMISGIFVLMALLFAVRLSAWITRSLSMLVSESARIEQLDFTPGTANNAPFREVTDVLQAFDAMRTGLRAFHKYMPVELVRLLLKEQSEPQLGGELREVTLMFSDVAGFTTISEGTPPMEMATILGDYLAVMTQIIEDEKGTVVQYVGDAIMAFWGAPLDVQDHGVRAANAVLRCQKAVYELRGGQEPVFHTRFGLHTAV